MASGPLAATMMALAPALTALFTHSICWASSLVLGDMNWTLTPSSLAAFWAPSFRVIQCWSMESMVIRAIMSPEPPLWLGLFCLVQPVMAVSIRQAAHRIAVSFFIINPPIFL